MSMSMSISIEKVINESILKGMSNMIVSVLKEVVSEYGVVNKEIIEKMNLSMSVIVDGKKKVALKEKTLKSKVVFPFNGRMNEGRCHALIQNHGLYTQCMNSKVSELYCSGCQSEADSSPRGIPNCGTIEQRLDANFCDANNTKPSHYLKVLKKLKSTT